MNPREVTGRPTDAALDAYRAAAHAEADAHFDERALEVQRHKILAKLAHLGETARVIRFPGAPRDATPPAPAASRRWVSVAAAAGLIIGLVSGQLMHIMPGRMSRPASGPVAALPGPLASPVFLPVASAPDDDLLDEIDVAIQLRSAAELRALDELTPFHEPR